MNTTELFLRVQAAEPKMSAEQVRRIVTAAVDEIRTATLAGETVSLNGFGAFKVVERQSASPLDQSEGMATHRSTIKRLVFRPVKEVQAALTAQIKSKN